MLTTSTVQGALVFLSFSLWNACTNARHGACQRLLQASQSFSLLTTWGLLWAEMLPFAWNCMRCSVQSITKHFITITGMAKLWWEPWTMDMLRDGPACHCALSFQFPIQVHFNSQFIRDLIHWSFELLVTLAFQDKKSCKICKLHPSLGEDSSVAQAFPVGDPDRRFTVSLMAVT